MDNFDIFLHTKVAMLFQRLWNNESIMLYVPMEHCGAESGLVLCLYGFWVPLIQPSLMG